MKLNDMRQLNFPLNVTDKDNVVSISSSRKRVILI